MSRRRATTVQELLGDRQITTQISQLGEYVLMGRDAE
jgi:hypothetical protein